MRSRIISVIILDFFFLIVAINSGGQSKAVVIDDFVGVWSSKRSATDSIYDIMTITKIPDGLMVRSQIFINSVKAIETTDSYYPDGRESMYVDADGQKRGHIVVLKENKLLISRLYFDPKTQKMKILRKDTFTLKKERLELDVPMVDGDSTQPKVMGETIRYTKHP